jgi:diketogulonate reductase-like aldo/keto reductase
MIMTRPEGRREFSRRGRSASPLHVPIPGTTKLTRLDENLGAATVELTPEDLGEIEESASKLEVQGARYTEEMERLSYR